MLLTMVVKVSCLSMTATDYRHRAITMLLILVEVSMKVLVSPWQPQTVATQLSWCYLFWWKYLKVTCRSTTVTNCNATYSGGSVCEATYSGGSICESGLAVPRAETAGTELLILVEAICESGLSAHNSNRLLAESYRHATYSSGSTQPKVYVRESVVDMDTDWNSGTALFSAAVLGHCRKLFFITALKHRYWYSTYARYLIVFSTYSTETTMDK